MQLEKEIMADRITGFYKSLDNIIGTFGIQVKLCDENLMIFKQSKQIIKNQEEVILNFSNAAQERDLLRRDYIELTEIKAELTKQKEKITKIFKEKFTSMQKELNDAVEIRETLRDKLEQADKKYLDIAEEFKRFRQKMKAKFSGISDKEEKFCKNCQKSFFESENFNWSCRVHASKMSGETYWCCGKVGKDSVGCIVSKHISKDEEDLIEDENLNGVLKFCSACKDVGHTLTTCFRDPNLKTGVDIFEEKKRLKELKRNKKRSSQSFEIQSKMNVLLSNKSALLHESYMNYDADELLFDDLNEIKEEVDFLEAKSMNRVVIEQKAVKKEENKKPLRKKTTRLTVYTNLKMDDD